MKNRDQQRWLQMAPLTIPQDLERRLIALSQDRQCTVIELIEHLIAAAAAVAPAAESTVINPERIVRFFDSALDFFCIISPNGKFLHVNPVMTRALGYTLADIIDTDIVNFIHPDDRVITQTEFAALHEGIAVERFSNRYRHSDGHYIMVEWTATQDEDGLVYGIGRDMSSSTALAEAHQRNIIDHLELASEREALEMQKRFIAIVSHELKAPLTVIRTKSDMLRSYLDRFDPETIDRHLSVILTYVDTMKHLLDNVQNLGLGADSKRQPSANNIQKVDLQAFLNRIREFFEDHIQRLHIELQEPIPEFFADEQKLWHIMTNLLNNAAKYSPKHESIFLKIYNKDDYIHFCVEDKGIGIPESDIPKIFTPLFRAQNTSSIEGSGLGLAVVKQYVEAHKGIVYVRSSEGKGTSITVTLPISAATK